MTPVRLTVVLTHPIQVRRALVPSHRAARARDCLDGRACDGADAGAAGRGIDRAFEWDVPLTEGYRSMTVRPPLPEDRVDSSSFTGLDVPEISRAIADTNPDVVMITGWYSLTLVRALLRAGASAFRRSIAATRIC